MQIDSHDYYMQQAVDQAKIAFEKGEVPIGSIVVCDGKIISKAYNMVEMLNDATAHAEMLAMSSAFGYFSSKYLNKCTLYVTLEPCCMCAGATFWSQLGSLVYGASDLQRGACSVHSQIFHSRTAIVSNVLSIQCEDLINDFFAKIRKTPPHH